MSSLPASPNPPKRRVFGLSRTARGALGTRLPAAYRRAAAPASTTPAPAAPAPPAARTGTRSIPEPPAAVPAPAVPARIPYSEWKGPRPTSVGAAFVLIVAAGVTSLCGGILASRSPVTELPSNAAQLEKLGVDAGEFTAALQVITVAAAIVVFGIYLLVAVLIREGRNWARIGGSVLAAAGLAAAVAAGSAVQGFAVLVAAGGLGLLYRGDCSRYFRPRRSQYLGMS